MISFVKGKIFEINETYVVVDVNNIGFKVTVPLTELARLEEGKEQVLHTYMNVREDAIELYGSIDKRVVNLFKKLIEVSGIGPKVAMGILSKMDVNDIVTAIINSDVTAICSCPGIGKKTAERLILELRDKLMKQNIELTTNNTSNAKITKDDAIKDEAIEALVNLGYKRTDSKKIIEKIYNKDMTLEEIIKNALIKG